MSTFRRNKKNKSYAHPILKIILCAALIVLVITRNHIIQINGSFWNVLISIICFQAVVAAVLCIYLSVAEMLALNERKKKTGVDIKSAIAHSKDYSVDEVLSLLISNDIIEITIVSNTQLIRVGASSDCYPGNSRFFDKNYYIDDTDSVAIDEIKEVINNNLDKGKVCVIAIDGAPPSSHQKT